MRRALGFLFVFVILGAVLAAPLMSVGAEAGLTTPSAPVLNVVNSTDEGPEPNAPSDLHVENVTATTFTVAWLDQSEIEDFYLVDVDHPGGTTYSYQLDANTTELLVDDLVCETEYFVRIQSLHLEGTVPYFSATVPNPTGLPVITGSCVTVIPNPPTGLTQIGQSQDSVTVEWVDTNSSPNEDQLAVFYRSAGTQNEWLRDFYGADVTQAEITGLDCSASYEVKVFAAIGNEVAESDTIVASTEACVVVPNPPTGLTQIGQSQDSVTVEWVDTNSSPNEDQLAVFYRPAGTQDEWLRDFYGADVTQAVISVLDCSASYEVKVFAAIGNEVAESDTIVASTEACGSTVLNPPVITGVTRSQGIIVVNWLDTNHEPVNEDRYVVWYRVIGTENYFSVDAGPNSSAAAIENLECGTAYSMAVYSYSGENFWPSNWITATTSDCLNPPEILGIREATQDSLTIGWVDTNDPPYNELGHQLWYRAIGTEDYFSVDIGADLEVGTIPGLTCATDYSLQVEAYDSSGNTAGSEWITARTADCVWTTFLPAVLSQP